MPREGHIGGLNSITRQGVRIVAHDDAGYPPAVKNVQQLTPTGNPDYYAFGNLIQISTDELMYIGKRGPDHIGGTDIFKMTYNAVTGLWTTTSQVAVTGSADIFSGVSAGKIGTHLYAAASKYNGGSDLFTDSGYIKSTDLTGSSWGSYVSITAAPYERFEFYGKFWEGTTGVFYTTRFSHLDGGSDPWAIEVIRIENDGADWTPVTIYDGATKYSEMAIAKVATDEWIGIARKFETNGVFGVFHTTNNWTATSLLGDCNLGNGPGNGDILVVDDQIHFLFQNRATGQIQISKGNTKAQVLALTFNTPTNYSTNGTAPGSSINGLGYPSWLLIRSPDVVYATWAKETSTSEAHIMGTLDQIPNF